MALGPIGLIPGTRGVVLLDPVTVKGLIPGIRGVVIVDPITGLPVPPGGGGGAIGDASEVTVTPVGGISSTDVQAALQELDNEKQPKNQRLTDLSTMGLTVGDIVVVGPGPTYTVLSPGAIGSFLHSLGPGVIPDWVIPAAAAASGITFAPGAGISATNVQAAINETYAEKQPLNARLTEIAALAFAVGDLLSFDGTNLVRLAPGTSGQVLRANGAALPSWATLAAAGDMLRANNLSDLIDKAISRVNLGVEIGVNVMGFDSDLEALANLTSEVGLMARIAANSYAFRSLVGGIGITILSNGNGVGGNPTITVSSQLAQFASLPTTGFITHIGPAEQIAIRNMTAAAASAATVTAGPGIEITNPAGVAGDVVFKAGSNLAKLERATLGGMMVHRIGAPGHDIIARTIVGAGIASAANGDGLNGDPTITVTGASIANMEATNSGVAVIPNVQHRHPSSPKVWGRTIGSGSPSIAASYNLTSLTDNGAGDLTVTVATDFSSASYGVVAVNIGSTPRFCCLGTSPSGAGWRCLSYNDAGSQNDPSDGHGFVALGDHV